MAAAAAAAAYEIVGLFAHHSVFRVFTLKLNVGAT